jgi:hypothetical protein
VLHTGQHQPPVGENGLNLFRQGGGAEVKIMGLQAQ